MLVRHGSASTTRPLASRVSMWPPSPRREERNPNQWPSLRGLDAQHSRSANSESKVSRTTATSTQRRSILERLPDIAAPERRRAFTAYFKYDAVLKATAVTVHDSNCRDMGSLGHASRQSETPKVHRPVSYGPLRLRCGWTKAATLPQFQPLRSRIV